MSHSFSNRETPSQSFSTKINNQKSFSSTNVSNKWFESIHDGFTITTSWMANFTINTIITVATIARNIIGIATTINSGTLGMSIDRLSTIVTHNLSPNITSHSVVVARMSELKNMGVASFQSATNIVVNSLERIPIVGVLFHMNDISISATATVAQYYLVSDWDASLLSTLDTMNLDDMDYQIV